MPAFKESNTEGRYSFGIAEKPKLHSGEDTRWDFKLILAFKNAALAFDSDLTAPYKRQLYPDLDKLTKDEQHRFELLISH